MIPCTHLPPEYRLHILQIYADHFVTLFSESVVGENRAVSHYGDIDRCPNCGADHEQPDRLGYPSYCEDIDWLNPGQLLGLLLFIAVAAVLAVLIAQFWDRTGLVIAVAVLGSLLLLGLSTALFPNLKAIFFPCTNRCQDCGHKW